MSLVRLALIFQDNYDAEIDAYKDHLERVYELCDLCKITVERELMKQDDALRYKLDAANLDTSVQSNTSQTLMVSRLNSCRAGVRNKNHGKKKK